MVTQRTMPGKAGAATMRLPALLNCLPGMKRWSGPDHVVTGVVDDSRDARPGVVFVAVPGTRDDGLKYVDDAVRRGAVAVVSTRAIDPGPGVPVVLVRDARRAVAALCNTFYRRPSRDMKIVGISGTNGKTTSCLMVGSILKAGGCRAGYLGTVGYQTGKRSLPARNTTPGPAQLHALLGEMRDEGLDYAVMEVSSHALVQRRTDFVRFAVGVFTNLSEEHLDFHGTMTNYRNAKARLFKQLGPRAFAAINIDDAYGEYYRTHTNAKPVTYGLRYTADVRAEDYSFTMQGSRFRLVAFHGAVVVHVPLLGLHNIYNSLAAATTALLLGFPLEIVRQGLENPPLVPGRLEPVRCGQPFDVVIDYGHTPHALECVLGALRPLVRGSLIVAFGAGGDRDRGKRPHMGAAVHKYADRIWVTSDNPRSESPMAIIEEICAGMPRSNKVRVEPDRRAAIEGAIAEARQGDLVLVAGKGHEREQVFADRTVEFDDREVAREALLARA